MLFISRLQTDSAVKTETPASNIPIKNDAYYQNIQDSIHNILITVSSDGRMDFMAIVSLQPDEGRTVIMPIPNDTVLMNSGKPIRATDLLNKDGRLGLMNAIQETTKISIDRYIASSREGFGKIINAYGSVKLEIGEDVDFYYKDIPVKLSSGEQILDGNTATMLLYYQWGSDRLGSDLFFGRLLNSFLEKLYHSESITNHDKFSKAINYADTDISYLDYLNFIKAYEGEEQQKLRSSETYCLDIEQYYDRDSKTIKKDRDFEKILLQYFLVK